MACKSFAGDRVQLHHLATARAREEDRAVGRDPEGADAGLVYLRDEVRGLRLCDEVQGRLPPVPEGRHILRPQPRY